MAGTPKKRAKQIAAEAVRQAAVEAAEAAAAEAQTMQATVSPEEPRARARVGIRGVPPPRTERMPPPIKPAVGQRTKESVDRSQVDLMTQLAQQLKPGLTVRIERLRPHWCAGWIEDYPLEAPDSMGEFYTYLREEHGGQYYRLTVLGAGEQLLFQAQVPIADRPKDRGRVIDRNSYEGQQQRTQNAAAPATTPAASGFSSDMLGAAMTLIQLLLGQSEKTNAATLASVQSMVDAQQRQTSELAAAVLQVRADTTQARPSFGEQLGEILEATRSLDHVRKQLGGTTQRAGAATRGDDDDDDMRLLGKEAKRAFMSTVMQSMLEKQGPNRPGVAQQPVSRVAPVTPIRQRNQSVVMDAIPDSGQRPRKN